MRPTRTGPLLLVALAVAVIGWAGLQGWSVRGRELPPLPWSVPLVMVALAVGVLAAGWPVRRWQRGDLGRRLDPLRAARVAVLAKAAQWCGALLSGWYAAQLLVVLPTLDVDPRRGLAVRAGAALLAAVAVWVVGWLVERWCRIDLSSGDLPGDREPGVGPTSLPAPLAEPGL
jgi:hypothetical protein